MSDENNVSVEGGEVSPEVAEVNSDRDLKEAAQRNWEGAWGKINAQHIVNEQQAALTRLREGVLELRAQQAHPKQADIDKLTRQYHDEIANIQPLGQEMVDAFSPAVGNQAWSDALEDRYRAEMTAPEVRGKPAEVKRVKAKFARLGLPVDQISIFKTR